MGYQRGLPAALAAMGLKVELVPGWETRGSETFNPKGSVSHWTAGPRTGDRPSLNICIYGRSDLPGPLCNVFLTRAGVAVVVAAGRANHAGSGGWRGLRGNASVFGTEAENSGGGEWTEAQRWAYPRINAAYAILAGFNPDMCCGHSEWAPTRKIDIHDYTMTVMRGQVSALIASRGLTRDQVVRFQQMVGVPANGVWGLETSKALQRWIGVTDDGVLGPISIRTLQTKLGVSATGVWGPSTAAALAKVIDNYLRPPVPVVEEDIMATKDELRQIVREELLNYLNTDLIEDWGDPATGETIRASHVSMLHLRDVKRTDGSPAVRSDTLLDQIMAELQALRAEVKALPSKGL